LQHAQPQNTHRIEGNNGIKTFGTLPLLVDCFVTFQVLRPFQATCKTETSMFLGMTKRRDVLMLGVKGMHHVDLVGKMLTSLMSQEVVL
jgi:hypothetical protein